MVAAFLTAGLVTSFIPLVGIPVFLAGGVGALAIPRLAKRPGLRSLVLAAAANAFVLGHSLWLFTFPGQSIRPMIWNAEVLLVGMGGVLCVGVLALLSMWREKRIVVPVLAFLAAVEALLLGWQILTLAARVRGFRIAD